MQIPVTVLIPTFNEENLIAQAITCSKFANEVLIIDSFSTDNTVAIAKKLNCTNLQREFDNSSNQKKIYHFKSKK